MLSYAKQRCAECLTSCTALTSVHRTVRLSFLLCFDVDTTTTIAIAAVRANKVSFLATLDFFSLEPFDLGLGLGLVMSGLVNVPDT